MNMTRYVSVINYDCERNNQFRFSLFFAPSEKQQIKDELCEVVQEMESHDSENKHSSKEKQMSIGRKKFNMDPKKGEYTARGLMKSDRCGWDVCLVAQRVFRKS